MKKHSDWKPDWYPNFVASPEEIHAQTVPLNHRWHLPRSGAHGHGTRPSNDHGNHWVVVEINRARNVVHQSPDGQRFTLCQLVTIFSRWIWQVRQGSFEPRNMEPDWCPCGIMILSAWRWDKERRESSRYPSEGTPHWDRPCTPNSHKKSHRIPIFFKSHSLPLGFKMRLVCDHWLLTNTQAKAKAASLKAHQAHFYHRGRHAQHGNQQLWISSTSKNRQISVKL